MFNMSVFSGNTAIASMTLLDDFCRLCLRQCGSQQMQSWRSASTSFVGESITIPDMLVFVCGLPANLSDDLPQRICPDCLSRLEQAFGFCREVKEKETILERFFMNGSILQRLSKYQAFRYGSESQNMVAEEEPASDSESPQEIANSYVEEDASLPMAAEPTVGGPSPLPEVEPCSESRQKIMLKIRRPVGRPRKSTNLIIPEGNTDDQSVNDSAMEAAHAELNPTEPTHVVSVPQPILPEELLIKVEPLDMPFQDLEQYSQEVASNYSPNPNIDPVVPSRPKKRFKKITQPGHSRSSKYEANQHVDGRFYCSFCPYVAGVKRRMKDHIAAHQALLEGRYKCTSCGFLFRKKFHLTRHMQQKNDCSKV